MYYMKPKGIYYKASHDDDIAGRRLKPVVDPSLCHTHICTAFIDKTINIYNF